VQISSSEFGSIEIGGKMQERGEREVEMLRKRARALKKEVRVIDKNRVSKWEVAKMKEEIWNLCQEKNFCYFQSLFEELASEIQSSRVLKNRIKLIEWMIEREKENRNVIDRDYKEIFDYLRINFMESGFNFRNQVGEYQEDVIGASTNQLNSLYNEFNSYDIGIINKHSLYNAAEGIYNSLKRMPPPNIERIKNYISILNGSISVIQKSIVSNEQTIQSLEQLFIQEKIDFQKEERKLLEDLNLLTLNHKDKVNILDERINKLMNGIHESSLQFQTIERSIKQIVHRPTYGESNNLTFIKQVLENDILILHNDIIEMEEEADRQLNLMKKEVSKLNEKITPSNYSDSG